MHATRIVSAAALVLLLFVQAALAVRLDPRGIGQVLIYPYYTVNKGQDTLISVVNPTTVSKAVQVRFLEGYNGRTTLAFGLYLSPHDVWTASISQVADDGGAMLKTSDASCTYPTAIPPTGVALRSVDYDGNGSVPADGGPTSITRTREGFIEFLVGGDITPGSPTDVAITHVQTGTPGEGAPPGCDTLSTLDVAADEVAPTGGIFGSGSIVNVGQGTFFPYNADAIQGFTSHAIAFGTDGQYPGGVSLHLANSSEAVAGVATAYVSDEAGRTLALDYQFGIDAVSAVFMADAIYNEYIIAATLGANTDWVVTFPTKAYYVDPLYGTVPLAPFGVPFAAPGTALVPVAGNVYDREEGGYPFGGPCSDLCPPPGSPLGLDYEVNVIPIVTSVAPAVASGVFGSNLVGLSLAPYGDDGQIALDLTDAGLTLAALPGGVDALGNAVSLRGLPVTGFMAYNVINAHAQPGQLANYSGVFPHRTTMACDGDVDGCTPINTGGQTP
jgi:hypothetical protein